MALCLVSYAVFLIRLTGRVRWPELYAGASGVIVIAAVTAALAASVLLAVAMIVTAAAHARATERLAREGATD